MPSRRARHLRLFGLAAAGAVLIALLAAFVLLYLRVPVGWGPATGYAPAIGPVFERAFPYPTWTLGPQAFRRAAVGLLVAMWTVYAAIGFAVGRLVDPAERRQVLGIVVGVCLFAHGLLVVLPPVLSTDLYQYGLFGRMVATYGLNPYVTAGDALRSDPLWPFAGWRHLGSSYGPVFTWISAGASALGGGGPIGVALAFKTVAALFNLVACWAVRRLALSAGSSDGLGELTLFALNPLLLVESAGSGHADATMMALAMVGWLLAARGRPVLAFGSLLLSALVKYVTGILAVLFAVHLVFAQRGTARRGLVAAQLTGVATLVLVALYGPFWAGGAAVVNAVKLATQWGSLQHGARSFGGVERPVALVLFAVMFVVAMVVAARAPRQRVTDLAATLITFAMVFVTTWHPPWYFVTGIALALVGGPSATNRALRLVTLLLGFLSMLLYGALLPNAR